MIRSQKNCEIVATLGPATDRPGILAAMMRHGLAVARLNFSHGTREEHLVRIRAIRQLNRRLGCRVKILQDLEGFRIRLGRFGGRKPIEIRKGRTVEFVRASAGNRSIPLDYEGPLTDIGTGSMIFIDDGNIALEAVSRTETRLRAKVVVPGILKERKGVNIPDFDIPVRSLTPKDQEDIRFGVEHRVDFIAQSFVRDSRDVQSVRARIAEGKRTIPIIAKIENAEGVRNLDEILRGVDGIMVARGDLGVSLPIHLVPAIQKTIIGRCARRAKISITATQMLESMTEHIRPTRAEVSDVANAVLDGSDYVMLSGETAIGLHPVETVRLMREIIRFTERWRRHPSRIFREIGNI